jgi:endonuclease YncB( thermonuclease family)
LGLAITFAFALGAISCAARPSSTTVVGVIDGDTVVIASPRGPEMRVRLAEIDAPEKGQPWGSKSKETLSNLVYGKAVVLTVTGQDRYGRTIARLQAAGQDVSAEMVRRGAAWAYRDYLKQKTLLQVEADARRERRGLWALSERETVPPWVWRRGGGASTLQSAPLSFLQSPTSGGCGTKHSCREMSSCAEARRYVKSCGLSSLDQDGDGVPCEVLCR